MASGTPHTHLVHSKKCFAGMDTRLDHLLTRCTQDIHSESDHNITAWGSADSNKQDRFTRPRTCHIELGSGSVSVAGRWNPHDGARLKHRLHGWAPTPLQPDTQLPHTHHLDRNPCCYKLTRIYLGTLH